MFNGRRLVICSIHKPGALAFVNALHAPRISACADTCRRAGKKRFRADLGRQAATGKDSADQAAGDHRWRDDVGARTAFDARSHRAMQGGGQHQFSARQEEPA